MPALFLKRIGRIISGNAHAMVDLVEGANPDVVFEEVVREINSAISDIRSELGKVLASKHLANKKLIEINNKHEDLTHKIQLAVKENRDDLAKIAISQQFDIEAQIPVLEGTIQDSDSEEKEFESFIKALQAKKREMKEEFSTLKETKKEAAKQAGTGSGEDDLSHSIKSKVESATSAFEKLYEKQAGVSVGSTYDVNDEAKFQELDDLVKENSIEEKLAAIKALQNQE
jgi:phage shock protein A